VAAVDVASAFAGEDDHEFLQLVIPATLQNHLMKVSGLEISWDLISSLDFGFRVAGFEFPVSNFSSSSPLPRFRTTS